MEGDDFFAYNAVIEGVGFDCNPTARARCWLARAVSARLSATAAGRAPGAHNRIEGGNPGVTRIEGGLKKKACCPPPREDWEEWGRTGKNSVLGLAPMPGSSPKL